MKKPFYGYKKPIQALKPNKESYQISPFKPKRPLEYPPRDLIGQNIEGIIFGEEGLHFLEDCKNKPTYRWRSKKAKLATVLLLNLDTPFPREMLQRLGLINKKFPTGLRYHFSWRGLEVVTLPRSPPIYTLKRK